MLHPKRKNASFEAFSVEMPGVEPGSKYAGYERLQA